MASVTAVASISDHITVSPMQAARALLYITRANRPAFLWGSPGIAKSDIVRLVSKWDKYDQCRDVRAVLLDPTDLHGYPYRDGNRMKFCVPEFMPVDPKSRGILFLDEPNRAPMATQNALLQLTLDRQLGEYRLPDEWRIVLAGNRQTDGGGVTQMSSALSNRMCHFVIEPDLNEWVNWAEGNIKAPVVKPAVAAGKGMHPVVTAFVKFRGELLNQFRPRELAFASPRSYHILSDVMWQEPDQDLMLAIACGCIGMGAGREFMSFYNLVKAGAPSLDAIIASPKTAKVPDNPALMYAIASGLSRIATVTNIDAVMAYVRRIPMEFAEMLTRSMTARDSKLSETSAYTVWSVETQGRRI